MREARGEAMAGVKAMSETRLVKHMMTVHTIDSMGFPYSVDKPVYLAADVEWVFKPVLEDYCLTIQTMLDATTIELPSKGPARIALAEVQGLLAQLGGKT